MYGLWIMIGMQRRGFAATFPVFSYSPLHAFHCKSKVASVVITDFFTPADITLTPHLGNQLGGTPMIVEGLSLLQSDVLLMDNM